MKETIEIRWHGRAGQGVVTAAVTMADVLSSEENMYVVVVTDPSLLGMVDISSGAKDDAFFLMNTTYDTSLIRERISLGEKKIYSLDAYTIATDELGKAIPNVPMVAALVKITGFMDLEKFKEKIRISLGKKLRPEIVEMNMQTIDRAFKEVKEG